MIAQPLLCLHFNSTPLEGSREVSFCLLPLFRLVLSVAFHSFHSYFILKVLLTLTPLFLYLTLFIFMFFSCPYVWFSLKTPVENIVVLCEKVLNFVNGNEKGSGKTKEECFVPTGPC